MGQVNVLIGQDTKLAKQIMHALDVGDEKINIYTLIIAAIMLSEEGQGSSRSLRKRKAECE